ncbi:hypothetical protein chiPu_0018811 [Chiloscyllium punctatum]|uniref:EF-hand domain-containing protein n=1 Tax=Chiloscyllium punctatum TaxID=137246 RepID=A0A401RPY8_CHIPU|nr:hypothetical protein [Chiloscyllium punctatum]
MLIGHFTDHLKNDIQTNLKLMMEPGNDQRANVLDLLKRSCSFDSFFQCRMTNEKECSGLTLKWRKSVDSLMCNKEQHSLLNDALIKRTISIPSLGTHELICETVANNSIEKSTDMNICSEEDVLNCTFESCDIEGKGEVYVSRIIGYLEDVTGQSCEKGQLKLLHKMLNSEGKDITVNLDTFHSIMKQWIAECRQEGETTELINDIECLEYTNRKLVDQNAKLQRSVEGFEETNVRLTEEIFDLKSKLKSSQQVLLQVKLLENELEDLKSIVKNLEDRNYKLQIHNRQLEKEQQNLSTLICQLQEENGKLIAEKDYAHWRNEELISEKVELKSRLYEAKRLLSVKDVLLTEKINQSEELKSTVDEYNNIIKGLKEEINRLQYHLTCEDLTIASSLQSVELQSGNAPVRAPEHSLQLEIEEIQQKTDLTANNLPTPLCGMVPLHKPAGQITDILCYVCSQLNWMDFYPVTEELFMQQDFEEEVKGFLRNINALFYSKIVRDMYKGNLAPQQLAVTQNYQETERYSHIRKGVTEKSELVAVEECVNAIPHRKGLKELQWSILDTEQVSEEGLSTARRLFRETEVMKKEIDRNTFGWEISDEEDYVNEKRTGAIQETLSFTVENATRLATETVWQVILK